MCKRWVLCPAPQAHASCNSTGTPSSVFLELQTSRARSLTPNREILAESLGSSVKATELQRSSGKNTEKMSTLDFHKEMAWSRLQGSLTQNQQSPQPAAHKVASSQETSVFLLNSPLPPRMQRGEMVSLGRVANEIFKDRSTTCSIRGRKLFHFSEFCT